MLVCLANCKSVFVYSFGKHVRLSRKFCSPFVLYSRVDEVLFKAISNAEMVQKSNYDFMELNIKRNSESRTMGTKHVYIREKNPIA